MSSEYNLNELAGEDYFTVLLDDHRYKIYYPTTQEIINLYQTSENVEAINKELATTKDPAKREALKVDLKTANQSYIDWLSGFVKPEGEAPDFKTTLLSHNLKFMKAFKDMTDKEFNG